MRRPGIRLLLLTIIAMIMIASAIGHCQQADTLNFTKKKFTEPVNPEYWKRLGLRGIEVDTNYLPHRVGFRIPVIFGGATFDSTANFFLTSFNSTADFSYATFNCTADFSYATFNCAADFSLVTFNSTAEFFDAIFDSTAFFSHATFNSTADFSCVTFDSTANFYLVSFGSTAEFSYVTFDSTAEFSGATFDSTADFSGATFNSTADFSDVTINSAADFLDATFDSTADFSGAVFGPLADFRFARFIDTVEFIPHILPERLDMRNVFQIVYPIDMTYSGKPRNAEKCKIALAKADVSKIWINMELFEISFPNDTNVQDGVIVRIDSTKYDDKLAVYEGLLNQFNKRGLKQSYEVLDKQYRHFVNLRKGWVYRLFIDPFQRIWWEYGYNPELVLLWTCVIWCLFSLINVRFYHRLNGDVYTVSFMGSISRPARGDIVSWLRYFLQTFVYTAVIFFGLKMSIDKFEEGVIQKHPGLFIYLMTIYVTGLVCLGFIVNIIFTK